MPNFSKKRGVGERKLLQVIEKLLGDYTLLYNVRDTN